MTITEEGCRCEGTGRGSFRLIAIVLSSDDTHKMVTEPQIPVGAVTVLCMAIRSQDPGLATAVAAAVSALAPYLTPSLHYFLFSYFYN